MDVTVDNFNEQLATIIEHVDNSDYMSIDLEFSGLIKHESQNSFILEDLDENYRKLKNRIKDYSIL